MLDSFDNMISVTLKSHFQHEMLSRTLVKSVYRKTNFLISQTKHILWVLKRTVSMRLFF